MLLFTQFYVYYLKGKALGLDVGLASFYTDREGEKVDNPRFLKKGEKKLKLLQRRLSKKKKPDKNKHLDGVKSLPKEWHTARFDRKM